MARATRNHDTKHLTRSGAAARQHDLLPAIARSGLRDMGSGPMTALGLTDLVTAHDNGTSDTICVRRDELARPWPTHSRTVVREIDRLARAGLITVASSAGRGRMQSVRLRHAAIDALTVPVWSALGRALAARMGDVTAPAVPETAPFTGHGLVARPPLHCSTVPNRAALPRAHGQGRLVGQDASGNSPAPELLVLKAVGNGRCCPPPRRVHCGGAGRSRYGVQHLACGAPRRSRSTARAAVCSTMSSTVAG